MRVAVAAMIGVVLSVSQAWGGVRAMRMTEPRPFGHFVGDIIERHADITVDATDRLDPASLPNPGQVAYWLDLVGVDVHESEKDGARHYRIDLKYQAFYVPLEPKRLTIPPLTVSIKTTSGAPQATLPAFGFTMSPLRELLPEKAADGSPFVLRPDIEPQPIKTGKIRTAMLTSVASALLMLGLLARHNAWWPFRGSPRRPFTEAARRVREAVGANGSSAGYRKGLLALHRAFDEAAGRRVLPEDLDQFLSLHPNLKERSGDIARFFAGSRSVFFADDLGAGIAMLPPSELSSLATRLASIERGTS